MATVSESNLSIAIYAADATQREQLAALAEEAACRIAGAAETPSALRHLTADTSVDAIVTAWPGDDDRCALPPDCPVPIIALMSTKGVKGMADALAAGAMAILPADATARDLRLAIAAAKRGLSLLPEPLLRSSQAKRHAPPRDPDPGTEALTARELDVLAAMTDGASNKAIARRLGISFHTVKFHVASVLEKLDAETRTEAVAEAARRGLVML